jgi:hypothetical protein
MKYFIKQYIYIQRNEDKNKGRKKNSNTFWRFRLGGRVLS